MSFPITKYDAENFLDMKLPIILAVKTYLDVSANILATTFLLFTFNYIPKRRQYESINA
jgi:hypothetical protein